jgi:hypothetical protein
MCDIDISTFVNEIEKNKNLWNNYRAKTVLVQRETLAIPLISAETKIIDGIDLTDYRNEQKVKVLEAYYKFPELIHFIRMIAIKENGYLSRCNIVSLLPLGKVYPHRDKGRYYALRDRYHLVIQTEGSLMVNGRQKMTFKEGELWWYNNKVAHSSLNESNNERIHVIFDLLPRSYFGRALKLISWIYFNIFISIKVI